MPTCFQRLFRYTSLTLELREYYYDTACAFRKTHVIDGNRLKYEGFEALSLKVLTADRLRIRLDFLMFNK